MDFEWDAAKATANVGKHGVSFEEAATSLQDDLAAKGGTLKKSVPPRIKH